MTGIRLLTVLSALLLAATARAAVPAGGEVLIDASRMDRFVVGPSKKGTSRIVAVDGQPFRSAIQLVSESRGFPWDTQASYPLPVAFKQGEVLLWHGWIRTIATRHESGQGLIAIKVGETKPPHMPQIDREATAGAAWQEFYFPVRLAADFPAGGLGMSIQTGAVEQTIEVAGVELIRYPAGTEIASMPNTRSTYAGREADAAWRAEAARRIEALRMAPMTVRVVDADGKAVAGASVRIEQQRHAFEFGCAVDERKIAGTDAAAAAYRERFVSLFNAGSFENSLKWPAWIGEWGPTFDRETTLRALRWFNDNRLPFRGHVLVWPSWRNLPESLRTSAGTPPHPTKLQRAVLAHIDDILGATGGLVAEWDLINEPRDNHDLMDLCGEQVMAEWFKRARERSPRAKLALNEYGILTTLTDGPTQASLETTVRKLLKANVPLDVLGFQGHFGATVPPPTQVLHVLDRFAAFGKPIRITEFTIAGDDDALKSDFARDAVTVAFSHPSVIGFQVWGLHTVFRDDGQPTSLGEALRRQIRERWWTTTDGQTNATGELAVRGFLGSYRVTVRTAAGETTQTFELTKTSPRCEVRLPVR